MRYAYPTKTQVFDVCEVENLHLVFGAVTLWLWNLREIFLPSVSILNILNSSKYSPLMAFCLMTIFKN